MKTKNILLASVGAVWLLSGCNVKDPIYNTPHPEQGKVILATDWTERTAGIDVPASYTACVGEYTETLSGEKNTLNHLFQPGSYRFCCYNVPEHITVVGKTASVDEITVSGTSSRFVHNAPGWLFSSAMDMAIDADKDHEFTVRMCQQVRQLSLVVELTGGAAERVTRIEGSLSGVAGTLDMDSGEHGTASNVELAFVKSSDGKYKATVRLLGIAGSEQKLTAQIYYEGNNPQPTSFESDLSTALSGFNSDKKTPLTLGGEVVETPTPAGFTAVINDWKQVSGGSVVAE